SGGLQSHFLEKIPGQAARIIDNGFLPSPYFIFNDDFENKKILNDLFSRSINKLNKQYHKNWSAIHCLLPTHLVNNESNILKHTPKIKSKFNQNLLTKIINNQTNKHLKHHLESGQEVEEINNDILQILIDNKKINQLDKDIFGQEMAIHHFLASTKKDLTTSLRLILAQCLKTAQPVNFHSKPLALYKTLSPFCQRSVAEMVFLETSGETTDILTIKDGSLHQIGWLPVGKNTIIRQIAEQTGESVFTVSSELELLGVDNIHPKNYLKKQALLTDFFNEWSFDIFNVMGEKPPEVAIGVLIDDNMTPLLSKHLAKSTQHKILDIDRQWLGLDALSKRNLGPFITSLFVEKHV
ncbi:MAG: hypothetical protein WDZ73_00520, partial [Candidatus Paceibacterota bacterium]